MARSCHPEEGEGTPKKKDGRIVSGSYGCIWCCGEHCSGRELCHNVGSHNQRLYWPADAGHAKPAG